MTTGRKDTHGVIPQVTFNSRSTGYEALLGHARNNSRVCLADPLVIQDKDDNYDEVIAKLQSNKMTRVVVVFADRYICTQSIKEI